MISGGVLGRSAQYTLVGLALALGATRADADESINVTVEGCQLDASELERLVKLELVSVLDGNAGGGYAVAMRCHGGHVHIRLRDPLTSKGLERSVLAPPVSQAEPERLLALTVAQLYRASWLELSAEPVSPLPIADVVPRPAKELASAQKTAVATMRAPPSKPEGPPKRGSVSALVGGRVRAADTPILLPSVGLEGSWMPTGELFWVIAATGFEWAAVTRDTGTLNTLLLRAGAGLGVEPLVSGPWSGFGELTGGVAIARISGADLAPGYESNVALGAGFEGSLGVGVAARVDVIRFELIGRVGLLYGTPAAIVSGDEDLSLDGVSGGLDLRVRWML